MAPWPHPRQPGRAPSASGARPAAGPPPATRPPDSMATGTGPHSTSMDKLAQFVSKSFDGATEAAKHQPKPAAKNWLVPDSPPPLGIDLRLKEPKARWLEAKTPSPKDSCSSSESPPIDLEDSKSGLPEAPDRDKAETVEVNKEDGDGGERKLCE